MQRRRHRPLETAQHLVPRRLSTPRRGAHNRQLELVDVAGADSDGIGTLPLF